MKTLNDRIFVMPLLCKVSIYTLFPFSHPTCQSRKDDSFAVSLKGPYPTYTFASFMYPTCDASKDYFPKTKQNKKPPIALNCCLVPNINNTADYRFTQYLFFI